MIKQSWDIESYEKERILNLHENATKNKYLIFEQNNKSPYKINFGNEFESGQYNFNPEYSQIVNNKIKEIANYISNNKLKDFNLVIVAGESQVPNQPPFDKEKGSLANKRAEVLKEYLIQTLTPILGFEPQIIIKPPVIGTTLWDSTKSKDLPEYKKEQFVNVEINLTNDTPKKIIPPSENPNKGFVINVRGDEKNNLGAFYFPKTFDDWYKITYDPRLFGFFSGTKQSDNNRDAFTTVNMMDSNFRKQWLSKAPDLEKLLGPAYVRDPKNSEQFILKNASVG